MSEEIFVKKDLGAWYCEVLENAGATPQEWSRFAQLLGRSQAGAFVAATLIDGGALTVAEAIDGAAESERKRCSPSCTKITPLERIYVQSHLRLENPDKQEHADAHDRNKQDRRDGCYVK